MAAILHGLFVSRLFCLVLFTHGMALDGGVFYFFLLVIDNVSTCNPFCDGNTNFCS